MFSKTTEALSTFSGFSPYLVLKPDISSEVEKTLTGQAYRRKGWHIRDNLV